MYVHEETWKINIHVIDNADHLLLLSPNYDHIQSLQDTLLIFDPKDTLPLHLSTFQKPVFYLYLYIQDYEKTIEVLKNYPFIQIQKRQDKIENSYSLTLHLLPSYFGLEYFAKVEDLYYAFKEAVVRARTGDGTEEGSQG